MQKPQIYSQKEFEKREEFFKNQDISYQKLLKAEKDAIAVRTEKARKKAEKEYFSKYFYTKEELLKLVKNNGIFNPNHRRRHGESVYSLITADFHGDTLLLKDNGKVHVFSYIGKRSNRCRHFEYGTKQKWKISHCMFANGKSEFKVPAILLGVNLLGDWALLSWNMETSQKDKLLDQQGGGGELNDWKCRRFTLLKKPIAVEVKEYAVSEWELKKTSGVECSRRCAEPWYSELAGAGDSPYPEEVVSLSNKRTTPWFSELIPKKRLKKLSKAKDYQMCD